ncbi:MAG: bifunctional UDP-sugar hydrolase/5'-nucleotidase [Deltaproteobacteria bacterium]|nr:bifunctional UDP-sugar hydrolase/5'-nucleotidase [Deltaproteobacteria bacterium]
MGVSVRDQRPPARRPAWLWLLTCLSCCAASPNVAANENVVISIVGTSDLHGHIEVLPTLGGYVKNLRAARKADGGAVLLVDAGDMFQGTLASNSTEGQVVVQAYNELGYAAAAVGNHEFDFGPVGPRDNAGDSTDDPRGALRARAAEARFAFLMANVVDDAKGKPLTGKNLMPSVLLNAAGLKVGVVGVTTIDTPKSTLAANIQGLHMQPLALAVATQAQALRQRGARIVLVLAHAGGSCRRFDVPTDIGSCATGAGDTEIFDVARALPRGAVDAIVAGHTHAAVAHEVNGIPIVQSYAHGRAFGRIDLVWDARAKRVREHHIFPPQNLCKGRSAKSPSGCVAFPYEGRKVEPDLATQRLAASAEKRVNEVSSQPLGATASAAFQRDYDDESALGNLVVDLMRAARPQADVALTNGGGLRSDLAAGPITYGRLFEVVPFDNTFALASVTGKQLAAMFAHNLKSKGGFLSQSGLQITSRCEGAKLLVRLARPDGKPIEEGETLTMVTNSFLASGGDAAFEKLPFQVEAAPPLRDELVKVIGQRGGVIAPSEFTAQRRHQYPGPRPVRCPQN